MVQSMTDLKELEKLVKTHLKFDYEILWSIRKSSLEGRGIFAERDIEVGEVIFKDSPLITGPRAGVSIKIHCVICLNTKDLKSCSKGCGLPVCSTGCEDNGIHRKECEFIRNHGGDFQEISEELLRSLTPIRGILMDENKIKLVSSLAKHEDDKHGFEIQLIKSKLKITESEERILKDICCVLDANAFETMVESEDLHEDFSLRGLYPISALLNHSCSPNSTHLFDEHQRMVIKSTVFIPKDTEILTTYTATLWATASRRHHLWMTKHFYCMCDRCKDPKEFNTCLSGLKCTKPETCEGVLFPIDPLNRLTKWKCNLCGLLVSKNGIGIIQSALGSLLQTVNLKDPKDLIELLQERIHKCIPLKNHIVAELKSRVIWMLGRIPGNLWEQISTEHLMYKETLCRELLDILELLGTGQCKLRGLLMCELYATLTEISKRKPETNQDIKNDQLLERRNLLREASEILYEDFRAPIEVKLYIDHCHSIL